MSLANKFCEILISYEDKLSEKYRFRQVI